MQPYYEISGAGTDIWAGGDSFLSPDSRLKKKSSISLETFPNIRKIFLIWSGEVEHGRKRFQEIMLTPAGRQTVTVTAEKIDTRHSSGVLYSCAADITRHYNGKGDYVIQGIESDPLHSNDKDDRFSVAGFAMLVIYDRPQEGNQRVTVYTGLDVLSPGEIHDISLLNKGSLVSLMKIAVVGGHGRKGNGSSNLLNGISMSRSEDWDGSSGHYWDVDIFDMVYTGGNEGAENGLVFSIDTVLQWVYPVVIATVFKEGT